MISTLRGRLIVLREACRYSDKQNSLVYEEVISDLTTLIHSLEIEQERSENRN